MKAYKINILLPLSLLIFFNLSQLNAQENCNEDTGTITITLPAINEGLDEEGFDVPPIWNNEDPVDEVIEIPDGRPIYALIVSGYASNQYLDEMMLYDFARDLMDKGAYVHYAWWNNLLAPYMERPLHNDQSHPGTLNLLDLVTKFTTAYGARKKALPGEDYQFVNDAKRFLREIRSHNPDALIVVAGHSMGGGAIVHLADELSKGDNPVQIDILAPIDPVGNRNIPWAGTGPLDQTRKDFNWSRWRASRDGFKGYRNPSFNLGDCSYNSYQESAAIIADPICGLGVHDAPRIIFRSNIINLYHRYQHEAKFPYDYEDTRHFGRIAPSGSINNQSRVIMLQRGESDVGGWPREGNHSVSEACCTSGANGDGWDSDGHGEIVGYRGPVYQGAPGIGYPIPLGVRLKTSYECGHGCCDQTPNCDNLNWPKRTIYIQEVTGIKTWLNNDGQSRMNKLKELENMEIYPAWENEPTNPNLCRVSAGLMELLNDILPDLPIANAGEDQVVECTGLDGASVTLDGSASERASCYTWKIDEEGENPVTLEGETVSVTLPLGTHYVQLIVTDEYSREASKSVWVDVVDTTPPELSVSLNPDYLWPPNHRFVDIMATVEAEDLCGEVETILYSIVASEADNVIGSGNTSPDISGAAFGTNDVSFKLRAERSGKNGRRVYTVTYKATDDSGNDTYTSANVVVENPSNRITRGNLIGHTRNYPNPFNYSTKISYILHEKNHVKITVYNLLGRELKILSNGTQEAGAKSITFDGSELTSGIYFYRIELSNNIVMTNKMLIKR